MMDSETAPCPWTPNSGLKSFRAQVDSIDYDPVAGLLNVQSPMKLFESTMNQNGDDDEFRSPSRPTKRQKAAPPSPATAMLLAAARVIDGDIPSGSPLGNSPHNILRDFEGSPGNFDVLGNLSPPSPARTPSRLLFSPKSEPRSMQRGLGVSPGSGMMTSYDGLLGDPQVHGQGIIGSIWKHSDEARRKTATSTARRPLLQHPTPHGKERLDEDIDVEPLPPDSTPIFKEKRPIAPATALKNSHRARESVPKTTTPSTSESRKDRNKSQPTVRKTYSTAGRPRVRGEYKCGKCGFYPKKSRHDCDEVKARAAAGIPIAVQVAEQQQREERNGGRNRNRNNSRSNQQHNISPSGTGTMLFAENERRMSHSPIQPIKLNLGADSGL